MFIYPENGDPIPIYDTNKSYIVTDSGATYEKLSPVNRRPPCRLDNNDSGPKVVPEALSISDVVLCSNKK